MDDGERSTDEVTASDRLGFDQQQIQAEMTELEERMFRLAEALKQMEPESSSRLMLGLKFSREELLVHRMQQLVDVLAESELDDAIDEQKQLISQLLRLRELLLSRDLDFQLQLERLRQIRAALEKLERAIKEEDRELQWSDATKQLEETAAELAHHLQSLDELIELQTSHNQSRDKLVEETDSDAAVEQLAIDQSTTRERTRPLADREVELAGEDQTESYLPAAIDQMTQAANQLLKIELASAESPMDQSLQSLQDERHRIESLRSQLEDKLSEEPFPRFQTDQMTNHDVTEDISEMIRQLGDSGAEALGETLRAATSMTNAAGQLGQRQAGSAAEMQLAALQSLKYARERLQEEEQRLLDRLRGEVKQRVIEGLTFMLEKESEIRAATETLGPKAAANERRAQLALTNLGGEQEKLITLADELIALVEETEFGIALPAALWIVQDSMQQVADRLLASDGSELVVRMEKDVEADLEALLEAMKLLPSSSGENSESNANNPQQRLRELNRILAELKMIRILQLRVNSGTVVVDKQRAADAERLSRLLRDRVAKIRGLQEDVTDVTEELSISRGNEIPSGVN